MQSRVESIGDKLSLVTADSAHANIELKLVHIPKSSLNND